MFRKIFIFFTLLLLVSTCLIDATPIDVDYDTPIIKFDGEPVFLYGWSGLRTAEPETLWDMVADDGYNIVWDERINSAWNRLLGGAWRKHIYYYDILGCDFATAFIEALDDVYNPYGKVRDRVSIAHDISLAHNDSFYYSASLPVLSGDWYFFTQAGGEKLIKYVSGDNDNAYQTALIQDLITQGWRWGHWTLHDRYSTDDSQRFADSTDYDGVIVDFRGDLSVDSLDNIWGNSNLSARISFPE